MPYSSDRTPEFRKLLQEHLGTNLNKKSARRRVSDVNKPEAALSREFLAEAYNVVRGLVSSLLHS
jgi:hypothetical protein